MSLLNILAIHVVGFAEVLVSLAASASTSTAHVNFYDLMGEDSTIAFTIFGFPIRWYGLAYLAGIGFGYWYALKMIAQPGAPFARRHADDFLFYATLGIIIGGRLGYVLFYNPSYYLGDPAAILRLWDGGMSFHGGALGVVVAATYLARKEKLNAMRLWDYVACMSTIGLFLGRLANFVNGELWGRPSDVPWAIIFPQSGSMLPRHPSQLYEAMLEGAVLFAILAFLFWRTRARYMPGMLGGTWLVGYGIARFIVEFFREPDSHLGVLPWGLTMGQSLTIPMLIIGLWGIATAPRRYRAIEQSKAAATAPSKHSERRGKRRDKRRDSGDG